jgi:hypothetical protein
MNTIFKHIARWFNNKQPVKEAKLQTVKQQLSDLKIGSHVEFKLVPDICDQLLAIGTNRYERVDLEARKIHGLVKAVYTADTTGIVYAEVVGLVLGAGTATRKEYVVLETDVASVLNL